MATYNFDKIINRKGTNCLEVRLCRGERQACGCAATVGRRHGLTVSEEITKSLHAAVDHGIYGYTQPKDAYYNAINQLDGKNHNWKTKRSGS